MGNIALAIGTVAIPIVFIVSGVAKFLNVSGIANHPGLTNFMNAFGEITSRTTLGYIIATIEVVGGHFCFDRLQNPLGGDCVTPLHRLHHHLRT